MDLDIITNAFEFTNKVTIEAQIECEVNIRGFFVNKYSLSQFIKNSEKSFEYREYKEIKVKLENNVTYRKRDSISECKTRLYKKDINNLWSCIIVSSEVQKEYDYNMFSNSSTVMRYSLVTDSCKIEIGFIKDQNDCWIDVEKISSSTPINYINSIKDIIKKLQYYNMNINIKNIYMEYNDYYGIDQIFSIHMKTYAKPITLTINNLTKLLECNRISPKYDGVRIFLVIRNKNMFAINLNRDVVFLSRETKEANELAILDCELVNDRFYIMDIPVYNNQYIGEDVERYHKKDIYKDEKNNIFIKPFYEFTNIEQVFDIYKSTEIPIDGIIFMKDDYLHDIYKWKRINTVDLKIKKGGLYTSDNQCLQQMEEIFYTKENFDLIDTICEFEYKDDTFQFIKERPDKPSANSYRICYNNIKLHVPENYFLGNTAFFMRKYHNNIKYQLLRRHQNRIILDIGTGQGGDLKKWYKNNQSVYCIEPSDRKIAELQRRYKKYNKDFIYIIKSYLGTLDIEMIGDVDIITAFFCMNLFQRKDLDKLIKILITKKPTHFIGIIVSKAENVSNECFTMALYEEDSSTYELTIHNTRIKNVREYVITEKNLKDLLYKAKYKLKTFQSLEEGCLLTPNEKLLSSYYYCFEAIPF
jgi:hypothetical protein